MKEPTTVTGRRWLVLLVALTLAITGVALASASDYYTDIEGHWAQEQIELVTDLGCFNGYPDGSFRPNENMTRAQFAVVVVNCLLTDTTGAPPSTTLPPTTTEPTTTLPVTSTSSPPVTTSNPPTTTSSPPSTTTSTTTTTSPPATTTTTTTTAPPVTTTTAPPSGDVVTIAAGVHNGFSVEATDNTTYVCVDGAILDGDNNTRHAFYGDGVNVVIDGCEIKNYTAPAQAGAIDGRHNSHFQDGGWTVQNVWVHDNAGVGVILTGNDAKLLNSHIEYNHQLGFSMRFGEDQLVDGVEVNHNNWLNEYDWGWEAGGSKSWSTTRLTVRNSKSHHNVGPGFWTDNDNINTLIENNEVWANVGAPGIFHEISYDAIIRNNYIHDNGYPDSDPNNIFIQVAGIQISSSRNVDVYGNTLVNNAKGLGGIDQCRGDGVFGPWILQNVAFHHNTVTDSHLSQAVSDCGAPISVSYYDNVWIGDNTYPSSGGNTASGIPIGF